MSSLNGEIVKDKSFKYAFEKNDGYQFILTYTLRLPMIGNQNVSLDKTLNFLNYF